MLSAILKQAYQVKQAYQALCETKQCRILELAGNFQRQWGHINGHMLVSTALPSGCPLNVRIGYSHTEQV